MTFSSADSYALGCFKGSGMSKRSGRWPLLTRDGLLLIAGIALTINEAVFRSGPERPYMLMLFAGMMGLPVFLRADEKRKSDNDNGTNSSQDGNTPPRKNPFRNDDLLRSPIGCLA